MHTMGCYNHHHSHWQINDSKLHYTLSRLESSFVGPINNKETEAYSGPLKTSKMEPFVKIVKEAPY